MIATRRTSTSAILACIGSIIVLLSGAVDYRSTLTSCVFCLAAASTGTAVRSIRLVEILPPAAIAVVTLVVQCGHTLELLPIPLPKPEIRFNIVANVWWHGLAFYVRVIRLEVIILCILTRSKIGWILVAGSDGPPSPSVATGSVVNLKLITRG